MKHFICPTSPYCKISSADIDFSVACVVSDSWDMFIGIPDWSKICGEIFLCRLFQTSPELQSLWGLDQTKPGKLRAKKFTQKGAALLLAVDKAVKMLGPNLGPLEKEFFALGQNHDHLGARPEHWPLVGDALIYTLKKGLGHSFSELEEEAWGTIYNFMAYWMIEGLIAEKKARWESDQKLGEKVAIERKSSKDKLPEMRETSSHWGSFSMQSSIMSETNASAVGLSENYHLSFSGLDDKDIGKENVYMYIDTMDVDYNSVQMVVDSWRKVLKNPNWQSDSAKLVLKKLFELVPDLKTAWGFDPNFDPRNLSDPEQNKFLQKGLGFMAGVDKAVAYLGPDLEPLTEELKELGRIHYLYRGAQPQFWPPVGVALMDTLEKLLEPKDWTEKTKQSWCLIYHFLAYWMIEGLLAEKRNE